MYIKKLIMKNFKQYSGTTTINEEQLSGLVGIIGKNGAGKSTILDDIIASLYGFDALPIKKDDIRTENAKESTILDTSFRYDDCDYRVERELKGKNNITTAHLYKITDDKENLIATGSNEVTASISALLNMNCETFIKTIFCSQDELSAITSLIPSKRKEFILKLAGVEKLDRDLKLTRAQKKEKQDYINTNMKNDLEDKDKVGKELENIDKDIAELKNDIQAKEFEFESIKREYNELKSSSNELDKKYVSYNEKTNKLNSVSEQIKYSEKQLDALNEDMKKISVMENYMNTKGYKLLKYYEDLKTKLSQMEEDRVAFTKNLQDKKSAEELENEISKIKNEIEETKSLMKKINVDAVSVENSKKEIDEFREKITKKKEDKASLNEKISQQDKKMSDLVQSSDDIKKLNNCECPVCKQAVKSQQVDTLINYYRNEYKKEREIKNNLVSESNKLASEIKKDEELLQSDEKEYKVKSDRLVELESYKSKISILNNNLSEKNKKYESIKEQLANVKEITFVEEEYYELKKKKENLDASSVKLYNAEEQMKSKPSIESKIDSQDKTLKSYKKEYQSLNEALKTINFDLGNYESMKMKFNNARDKYDLINRQYSELKLNLKSKETNDRVQTLSRLKDITQKEEQYSEIKTEIANLVLLEENIIKTKENIIAKINPAVNFYLSNIFKELMDNKYDDIELDGNFDIYIYKDGRPLSLDRFSGGEKDIANLSLRLAISKFLAELNGSKIQFIALDEVFRSLDDDRKVSLARVLQNLKGSFKQIIVISHEDVIRAEMDKTLFIVQNENGFSSIAA